MPIHLLNKSSRFLTKIYLKISIKALKNLNENKDLAIQKVDKANSVVFLNKNDYISRLNQILDGTSKFKRLRVEEGKALSHTIYMEESIIDLPKSLKNQNKISEQNYDNLYPSDSKPGIFF